MRPTELGATTRDRKDPARPASRVPAHIPQTVRAPGWTRNPATSGQQV